MKFKVGDVCEVIRSDFYPKLLGMECTIVQIGGVMSEKDGLPRDCRIDIPGTISQRADGTWVTNFITLRLKRPPSWNEWLTDTREVERENSVPA